MERFRMNMSRNEDRKKNSNNGGTGLGSDPKNALPTVAQLMHAYAHDTGLEPPRHNPRRYLWTDAFAVCNLLELYRQTADENHLRLALALVDQVHHVLGRHRPDDRRTGWISGLDEEEGKRHPTRGGLRIGKSLPERGPHEAYDHRMEWDRDGQYYHYLTKWMHALNRVSRETNNPMFNTWALELAKAAHTGFVHPAPAGAKRMFWKMSIDLTYPLVPSMGHHDPLDGLITYHQLSATALEFSNPPTPSLESEIADLETLCRGKNWATDDPLGIGGLLGDADKVSKLIVKGTFSGTALLSDLLDAALEGLTAVAESRFTALSADYRLAFRELGMAIGLHAVPGIQDTLSENIAVFPADHPLHMRIDRFSPYMELSETIEQFWLDSRNRNSKTWMDHEDINRVMLATSLAPEGYLVSIQK
ncbi:MAG: hypothetical protein R6U50_18320 [Desulfobacterales bacterium]